MGSYRRESDLRTLALECRRLLLEAGIRLKLTPMRPMHLVCVDIVLNGVCLLLTESNNFTITHICATWFVACVGGVVMFGSGKAENATSTRAQKLVSSSCSMRNSGGGFSQIHRQPLNSEL